MAAHTRIHIHVGVVTVHMGSISKPKFREGIPCPHSTPEGDKKVHRKAFGQWSLPSLMEERDNITAGKRGGEIHFTFLFTFRIL